MKRRSASTLIYFQERSRKKLLAKRPVRVNKGRRAQKLFVLAKVVLVLSVVGVCTWLYLKYLPLNIESVKIVGAERFVNKDDVGSIVRENVVGKNILFMSKKELEEVIANNFLAARSVEIKKILPKTLAITISERVPIALVYPSDAAEQSKEFYFVDLEGFVLGLADKQSTNLPVINYTQEVEVGRFIESGAVKYYFDLIKVLDEDGVLVSTISSYPRYTQFFTREGTRVLFNNEESPRPQAKVLTRLMDAFKAEGKEVRKIDLRFGKVIVEFIN